MKFKVLKGTELFTKLTDLKKKIDQYDKQAKDLAKEFGGDGTASAGRRLAGGIEAIHFEKAPDKDLWKVVGQTYQDLFLPKAKHKEAWKKISALPTLDNDDLNDLIKFKQGAYSSAEGIGWVSRPAVAWYKDYVLINTSEGYKYKPVADMIEIKESEYDKLNKKKK